MADKKKIRRAVCKYCEREVNINGGDICETCRGKLPLAKKFVEECNRVKKILYAGRQE